MQIRASGRNLHIDCHLVLPFYYTIAQEHIEVKQLEQILADGLKQDAEIFVHTDPCKQVFCTSCKVADCTHRIAACQPS